jgi:RNA polymerase sigma-70 factor (ECF subfamily)
MALGAAAPAVAPNRPCGKVVEPIDSTDIRATLQGDGEAYGRIVRRHQDAIATRMRRFTRAPYTVEELVQEVFVQAYFALPRYRGEAPLEHWLNRIATRVGYQFLKQAQRHPVALPLEDCDAATAAEDPRLQPQRAAELLDDLLAQLPPRDRLVLTLLYLEDRSVADAAEVTGWSRTMIKVQAFRARQKLRKIVQPTTNRHTGDLEEKR